MSSPRDVFNFANSAQVRGQVRPDWQKIKTGVMHKALLAKFHQHPDLHKMLCATGGRKLIEHTSNDKFWGDGGDGSGQNMLGKTLMRVRKELCGV
jgi:hypothetical protein